MKVKTLKKYLSVFGNRQLKQCLYTSLNYVDIMVPTSNFAKKYKVGKFQNYLRFNIVYEISSKELVCLKEISKFMGSCIFWGIFYKIDKIINITFELVKTNKYDDCLELTTKEFFNKMLKD